MFHVPPFLIALGKGTFIDSAFHKEGEKGEESRDDAKQPESQETRQSSEKYIASTKSSETRPSQFE